MPDLVIFDCDGVIVDSEIIAATVEAEMLAEAGVAIAAEDIMARYAGLTFRDILLSVERDAQVPLSASLLDRCHAEVDRRLATELNAIDGVERAIASAGERFCIASNSNADRIAMMLRKTGLADLFDGNIYSAFDVPNGKPKPAPDVFLHAARAMGAEPARTIVIEDSVHGVKAAKAAGMRVIGFTGGAHSWPGHADALTEAGAETVVRRHADVPATIEALMLWNEPV
ncbi:MAG: HAD family hydrolase [Phyllobacteriaceae bacterium]|nr:HAD family hydrolase [Phyllobacteriaceae bacterium]